MVFVGIKPGLILCIWNHKQGIFSPRMAWCLLYISIVCWRTWGFSFASGRCCYTDRPTTLYAEVAMLNPLTYGLLLTITVLGIVILILTFEKFWIKRKSPLERQDRLHPNLIKHIWRKRCVSISAMRNPFRATLRSPFLIRSYLKNASNAKWLCCEPRQMLTYCHVCCAFSSAHALPFNVIYYFWDSFSVPIKSKL